MKNQLGESAPSKETVPSSKMLARNLYDAILYTAPTAFVIDLYRPDDSDDSL